MGIALGAACVAVLGGSSRVSAATPAQMCTDPTATNVRQICVAVFADPANPSTSVDEPRYVQVDVSLTSLDQRNLTHPNVTVSLTDNCSSATCPTTAIVVASKNNACTTGTTATCAFASLKTGDVARATLYVQTSSTPNVVSTSVSATGQVDEGSDNGSPDNGEVTATTNVVYETVGPLVRTLALGNKNFHLKTTDQSEFDFSTPSAINPFTAQFDTFNDSTGQYCFAGLPCFAQTLHADLSAGGAGSFAGLGWKWTVFAPFPSGVTDKSILVVHTYDALSVTASATEDTFTPSVSYAGADGVIFSGTTMPAGVTAGVQYYVVNGTSTSFKIATSKSGKPIDITSAGSGVLASKIRIVGDTKNERTGCTNPSSLPNMSAAYEAGGKTAIDLVFCDDSNGWVQGG